MGVHQRAIGLEMEEWLSGRVTSVGSLIQEGLGGYM